MLSFEYSITKDAAALRYLATHFGRFCENRHNNYCMSQCGSIFNISYALP